MRYSGGMRQNIIFLDKVEWFIQALPCPDQAKIAAHTTMMREGDFASVHIKQLDGPIQELIVRQYRLIFFRKDGAIYVVGAFRKKSAKTPLREIRYAMDIFRNI